VKEKEAIMPSTTQSTSRTSRTAQLLALMTKGDDAFNDRDFEVLDAVHHPDMIAFNVPGISSMLGARRSSHASATCAVVALRSRATLDRVEDWSGANPPSGKNGT